MAEDTEEFKTAIRTIKAIASESFKEDKEQLVAILIDIINMIGSTKRTEIVDSGK